MTPSECHNNRRFAETPFNRIAYLDHGTGPAALFVHGLPLCGYQWRGTLEDLAGLRRCIAPDMMGLGYTETRLDQDVSFAAQARMLAALLDALAIDSVDLCGNDTGGGISQIFAATFPERVRSLTLTNCEVHDRWPNAMLTQFYQGMEAGQLAVGLKAMLTDVNLARQQLGLAFEYPEALTPELVQLYITPLVASEGRIGQLVGLADWRKNRTQLTAVAARLKASTIPAQIIWGDADSVFDAAPSLAWLQANLGGLRRTTIVPRAKLFFPEEHPRLVSVVLKEFWNSLS